MCAAAAATAAAAAAAATCMEAANHALRVVGCISPNLRKISASRLGLIEKQLLQLQSELSALRHVSVD